MSSTRIAASTDAAPHHVMPDRAGADRIRVGSLVRHRDFSFQRGHVVGLFILDGLAWAEVRWDGFDRPHLVDPEVLRFESFRIYFAVAVPRDGLRRDDLPKRFVEIDFTRAGTFVHPDAQELPKESAEARGGGAKGEFTDDRSEGEAAEGAPVDKTATDQATGQVQAGAVDPDSASAPKPSTSSVPEHPARELWIHGDRVRVRQGLSSGAMGTVQRRDGDFYIVMLDGSRRRFVRWDWLETAPPDIDQYAVFKLHRTAVRDLAAIAEAVGNTNGGPDITLGIVRELVAQRARWARMFDEPKPISKLAGAWISLTDLKPGITREHAGQELDRLLDRVRREEREACADLVENGDPWEGHQAPGNPPSTDEGPLFALRDAIAERIRGRITAAEKTSKGGTNMRAAGESPERGAEEHARPEEPNTMQRDSVPGSDSASAGDAARIRALADHLEAREDAPSLKGYTLADGLRAAARLLEGEPGPLVHDDHAPIYGPDPSGPYINLRNLLDKVAPR